MADDSVPSQDMSYGAQENHCVGERSLSPRRRAPPMAQGSALRYFLTEPVRRAFPFLNSSDARHGIAATTSPACGTGGNVPGILQIALHKLDGTEMVIRSCGMGAKKCQRRDSRWPGSTTRLVSPALPNLFWRREGYFLNLAR